MMLIPVALVLAASSAATPTTTEQALLKDWALARCLAVAGKGQPLGDDAAKSAAALLERGRSGIEVYERIEALAHAALARRSGGSVPSGYNVLKCVEFYHSKALDRVAGSARRP